jgi:hypothetical protein
VGFIAAEDPRKDPANRIVELNDQVFILAYTETLIWSDDHE